MRTGGVLALALLVGVAACGGDDDTADSPSPAAADDSSDSAGSESAGDDNSGGAVTNPQPAGQAMVSVDGQEFTLTEPGAIGCALADDSITFSFRIGDNEITLGAGANRTADDWFGGIDFRIANPSAEAGPINYFPDLPTSSSGIVVDGQSFSYSGPMLKQPPNDGSNPPPVDAGEGTISITCP